MDRRERDWDNRDFYGPYEGYGRNDEHYHAARNLTDQFEQEYRRERGNRGGDRMPHTFHEGSMGDTYEQRRREGRGYGNYAGSQWNDRDRDRNYSDYFSRDRDRFSNSRHVYGEDRDRHSNDWDKGRQYSNSRQGYGNAGGYSTYNMDDFGSARGRQDNYPSSRNDYRSSHRSGRNYGGDNDHEGSYGVRGGDWFSRDRDNSDDNWRAKHRLRSDF